METSCGSAILQLFCTRCRITASLHSDNLQGLPKPDSLAQKDSRFVVCPTSSFIRSAVPVAPTTRLLALKVENVHNNIGLAI
jgi:hypothetical protein